MADAENLTPDAPAAADAPVTPVAADTPAVPADLPVAAAPAAPSKPRAAPLKVRKPTVAAKPAVPAVAPAPKRSVRKAVVGKAAPAPKAAAPKPAAPRIVASKPAPKRLSPSPKAAPVSRPLPTSKDQTMASNAFDFTTALKTAFADIQEKAKSTYQKSSVALTEVNEFAKGNVEAVVESGKILASGLQELGSSAVADSRAAFETLTAEAKSMTTVTSPTAFFELQSALMRKQFDVAVSHTSKNAEAMLKLMGDSFAPISNRVAIAVEKVSKAA